ncbi:MAG TPA: JAB domain-containing protein [Herpetosiphonaceae bacterium]
MSKKQDNLDHLVDAMPDQTLDPARSAALQGTGRSMLRLRITPKYAAGMDTPVPLYKILRIIFATLDRKREHILVLALDEARDIIGYETIVSRSRDCAALDATAIFRKIVVLRAMGVVVAHSHLSEQLDPSEGDALITARLMDGCRKLDVELLDHIIYTQKGYTSLREVAPHLFA